MVKKIDVILTAANANILTAANDNGLGLFVHRPILEIIAARVRQVEDLVASYKPGSQTYGPLLDRGIVLVYEIAKQTQDPEKVRTLFLYSKAALSEQQIALLDEIVNTGIEEYAPAPKSIIYTTEYHQS
tara:strand:- start:20 stop:406 length:387 start_codon:yes stop_codon:yes gene_type:complete